MKYQIIKYLVLNLFFCFPFFVIAGGGLTPAVATFLTFNGELANDINQTWPASGSLDKAACSSSSGTTDVWYSFTASSATQYFILYSAFDGMISVWTADLVTNKLCVDALGSNATEFGNASTFTIGQTYYVQILPYTSSASGSYSLCITSKPYCWIGLISTDWATSGNWANNSLPTNTSDVYIPNMSGGNNPTISGSIIAKSKNLTINSSGVLTFAGDAYSGSDDSQLIIYGDLIVNGNFNNVGSTYIYLRGANNVIGGTGDFFYGSICPIMIGDYYYGVAAGTYSLTGSIKVSHFYIYPGSNFVLNSGCTLSTSYFFQEGTGTTTINGTLEILGPPTSSTYLCWLNPGGSGGQNPYFTQANLVLGLSSKISYCAGSYSSYNGKFKTYTGTSCNNTEYFYVAKNQTVVSGITYNNLEIQTSNGFTVTVGNTANITVNSDFTIFNPSTAGGIATTAYNVNVGGDLYIGATSGSNPNGNALTLNCGNRIYRSSGTGTLTMGNNTSHVIDNAYEGTYGTANDECFTGFGTPTFYGTFNYSKAANQEIISGSYYHLTLSGGGFSKKLLGSININGDFSNNCTSAGLVHNSQTVSFTGNIAQSLGGALSSTFYNLTINNTSSTGITLLKPTTISNGLTLTDGNLYTDATNLITLNDNANSSSGSTDSYVDGPLKKIGNDVFVFPVGDGGRWRRLEISTPANSTTEFTAQYFYDGSNITPHTTFPPSLTAPLTDVAQREYWEVTRAVNADNVTVKLFWEDASASNIDDCTDLTIGHWNGSSWVEEPATATGTCSGSGAGYVLTDAIVTSFSPITFGSKSKEKNILPIKLIKFDAICEDKFANIKWSTASEINNDYFSIEKSNDLSFWSIVDFVKGQGNSSEVNEYSIKDYNIFEKSSFYRLKQVDYDGNYTIFPTITLECENKMAQDVYIINDLNSENIILKIDNLEGEEVTCYLIDNIGRYVSNEKFKIDNNNFYYSMSKSSFGSCIYNLVIVTSNSIIPRKIIIPNRKKF